jgi:hypothetical protein
MNGEGKLSHASRRNPFLALQYRGTLLAEQDA